MNWRISSLIFGLYTRRNRMGSSAAVQITTWAMNAIVTYSRPHPIRQSQLTAGEGGGHTPVPVMSTLVIISGTVQFISTMGRSCPPRRYW